MPSVKRPWSATAGTCSRLTVSLLLTALLAACPNPVDPLPVPDEPYGEIVAPKGTSLLVEVQDAQGSPVTGAVVKAQDKEVEVNARGMVLLEELTSNSFVLRVDSPGFVPHAREVTLEADASSAVAIRLMPQGPPQRFDTSQASQVRSGGIKVSLPAGSLRDVEGNPVTGPADMYIAPIDPTTDAIRAAPGPLVGISAGNGEQVPLESFFMAEINIRQNGQPLQLAEGAKATLEFPIPAAIHDRAPVGSSIPAWWFDTQRGAWREEGAGVVTESASEPGKRVWTVQVGHFTSWNADKPFERSTCIKVKVLDPKGKPVPSAPIELRGVSLAAYHMAQTGADGSTCMLAPVNSRVKLSAFGPELEVNTSATPATCSSANGNCTEVTLTMTEQPECAPGTWQSCPYGGPAGTAGVGLCRAGFRICSYRGSWSSCYGQVTPQADMCTNTVDEDCDGTVNEDCPTICQNGETRSCYRGAAGTAGVGLCRAGTQTCAANGTTWSFCSGERWPLPREYCFDTTTDEDCDGTVNEGCSCVVGQTRSCYSGSAGTQGVGVCRAGIQRCHMGADQGSFWSACSGEVLPSPEDCSNPADENCDGTSACGECTPGQTRACYSGPEGTQGVGICVAGSQTCGPTGSWQACTGEVTPQPAERCTTAEDDDCDGQSNESPPCVCTAQETRACYSGPAGTQGVGRCRAGSQACATSGEAWEAACTGELLPEYERCDGTDRDCDGASSCTGAWTWSTPLSGGPENQSNESTLSASDVAVDAQGNVFLTGTFDKSISLGGTLHTGNGYTDLFLVKLNSAGAFQWGKVFGDAQAQQVRALTVDAAGRVIVVGFFQGSVNFGGTALTATGVDGFVAVFTSAGEHVWSARFAADTNLQPSDVAVDGAGNVLVAGNFSGSFPCLSTTACTSASNSQDFFVRAYSSEGTERWTRTFGGAGLEQVNGLAVNGTGELALVGSFTEGFSLGASCPALTHAGGEDGFVAKLSTTGACVWSQRFGDSVNQQATTVAMNGAGEVFFAGNYQGTVTFGVTSHSSLGGYDLFVVKLDAQGGAQWSRGFGAAQDQTVTSLVLEPVGNLVLAGSFLGTFNLGGSSLNAGLRTRDMFVAKLSATYSGSHVWSRDFGDADEQVVKGLAVGPQAQVMVTGDFGGEINFGGAAHLSAGVFDVVVARLKP